MLTALKSSARKNAPRTRCVTIVVSSRLFIPGFLLDEFEHFMTFISSSYLSEPVSDEVPVWGEAWASE